MQVFYVITVSYESGVSAFFRGVTDMPEGTTRQQVFELALRQVTKAIVDAEGTPVRNVTPLFFSAEPNELPVTADRAVC